MSTQVFCENCEEHGHLQKDCMSLPIANLQAAVARDAKKFELKTPCSQVGIVDTHCHLETIFDRLRHQGGFQDFRDAYEFPENISGSISSFSDPACYSSFGLWESLLKEPGVWGTFGVHPHCAKYYNDEFEAKIISCLEHPKAVAVGECGLDYSLRSVSPKDKQHVVFRRLLKVAVMLKKPVVVHCREAEADCFEIMKDILPSDWHIHLHCYTGDMEQADKYMTQFSNLFFGVTNLVTYPTATQVHQIATDLPLRRLLLETDGPYFVPQRLKATRILSHSGLLMYAAVKIAQFHKCSLDHVLETCQKNAEKMYGLTI